MGSVFITVFANTAFVVPGGVCTVNKYKEPKHGIRVINVRATLSVAKVYFNRMYCGWWGRASDPFTLNVILTRYEKM